jgi:methylmalonyl-CoA mutase N-terminal domain/subunit
MLSEREEKRIREKKRNWELETLAPALKRFDLRESPNRYFTPLDLDDFDYLEKVGLPGSYPYTAGIYPCMAPERIPLKSKGSELASGKGLVRAGGYRGYGIAEDMRDFYLMLAEQGVKAGPNLAFDLPTQLGYDSDHPRALGEVGKTGVAIDTLRDFEILYEAFTGEMDLDKIASNWTINAPCNIILAMYIALAEERGIPLNALRGTPQNDILKEYVARGTFIFPIGPSMRMVRDTITYCSEHLPAMNVISICGSHMREAGATAAQDLAFVLSNSIAYVQLGVDAGLDVDEFVRRFTWLGFGGSMDLFLEIATSRASRRMWAKIMRERFGAKDPRSWILRSNMWARTGEISTTLQRPLNNLCRSIIGGIASVFSGGAPQPGMGYPFDEPLGLGHSFEAWQLHTDAARIIEVEAKLSEVADPLAGSYYLESLTDKVERETQALMEKIESMGGAEEAIENGFMQREIAKSAFQFQKEVESRERRIVGVNCFTGENEIEVMPQRMVAHPYDEDKLALAGERQVAKLQRVKKERDQTSVKVCLEKVKAAAHDESVNIIPPILDAVKAYATIGEICDALRDVWGEQKPAFNI